jgi:hypothetical protein
MIKHALVLIGVLVIAPTAVAAQGLGFGVFGGTLGLGGEAAIGVTDRFVVRGGYGFMPFEPSVTVSDLEVTLDLPSSYHVGIDLYVNNALRFGGGVLFRTDDPSVKGTFQSPQEIGGTTFQPSEIGTLTGVFDARDRAPYLLLGFGRHTEPRVGLFIDLGVVFVGEPDVVLGAEGGSLSADTDPLKGALDREATDFEQDMKGYLKFWPFLNLGVRIGLSQ